MEDVNQLIAERRKKLEELRRRGIDPYPTGYQPTHHAADLQKKYAGLKNEEKTEDLVRVAGRILVFRRMGKATFAHLQDQSGKIQLYFKEDELGLDNYEVLKLLDAGDIIGAEGIVFKTKTGEVTLFTKKYQLLTKSLLPLPEKFHGLKDTELRYRQRYVDLIMNPNVRETFVLRTKIIAAMRKFLEDRGYLEVETPTLQPVYGGASARPFTTHHNTLKRDLFLRISDELYLKRLIVGGYEKVFEICKDFRNEGIDTSHNPEFTMMETMTAYHNYEDSMKVTEEMLAYITQTVLGTTEIEYQRKKVSMKAPYRRVSMAEAVKEVTGKDFSQITSVAEARKIASELKVPYEEHMGVGAILAEVFGVLAEHTFVNPTFITDYPKEVSPLAKETKHNKEVTERFELIIAGREYVNSYSELNEPDVLKENWQVQEEKLQEGDAAAQRTDQDFLRSLEYGMPPTSGIGVGMDRLVMLLTNSVSIRDVLFFPILKDTE